MAQNRWRREPSDPTAQGGHDLPPIASLEVVYASDPDVVRDVVPPPLEVPSDAKVHLRFTDIDLDLGAYRWQEKVAWFGVDASYQGLRGEYPLIIPIDLETAVAISREKHGEPKKLADITVERNGDDVQASMTRLGVTFAEIIGTITGTQPTPEPYETRQWWFKFLPAVSGRGFDGDVHLVQVDQVRSPVSVEAVDAKVVLRDLPSAPLADLPVEELVSARWTTRRTTTSPHVVATVDPDAFEPFAAARYDR
jgi:acetoacetate decarboxylase